jgi:hypothetical protein
VQERRGKCRRMSDEEWESCYTVEKEYRRGLLIRTLHVWPSENFFPLLGLLPTKKNGITSMLIVQGYETTRVRHIA